MDSILEKELDAKRFLGAVVAVVQLPIKLRLWLLPSGAIAFLFYLHHWNLLGFRV